MKKKIQAHAWWGGVVSDSSRMPYAVNGALELDFSTLQNHGATSPFFINEKGTSVYSPSSHFTVDITSDGTLTIDSDDSIKEVKNQPSFQAGCREASWRFFSSKGLYPPSVFFEQPQFSTWMEYQFNVTQEKVLSYAHAIIAHSYKPGVFIIDEGWMSHYGSFTFDPIRFPDPKAMIEEVKQLGFTPLLWVSPFVSPDSSTYRALRDTPILLYQEEDVVAIRGWWNGYSALLNLSSAEGEVWFTEKLNLLKTAYGIAGFKFDGGDLDLYSDEDCTPYSREAQSKKYSEICSRYCPSIVTFQYDSGGLPLVQNIGDTFSHWGKRGGLAHLIPSALTAGLMGYCYVTSALVDSALSLALSEGGKIKDEELYLRFVQCCALFPTMQFNSAPWSCLSEEGAKICLNMAMLHQSMASFIIQLIKESAREGKPLIRSLYYEFEDEAFLALSDQFMLGSSLLVAPVLEKGAEEREIVFPRGRWIGDDFTVVEGPTTCVVSAPLERLPYYRLDEE